MLLRSTYGGRGWDVSFLKAWALCWLDRFTRHPTEWDDAIARCYGGSKMTGAEVRNYFFHVDEEGRADIASLKDRDKLAEAVDFHCYPKIVDTLLSIESLADYTKEEVEKAIWYHRSGVYEKRFITDRQHADVPMMDSKDALVDTKVQAGEQRTLDVWERIKGYLEETVATSYYWKGRPTPVTRKGRGDEGDVGEAQDGGSVVTKKAERKRKRQEAQERLKKEQEMEEQSAESLRHFLLEKQSPTGGAASEQPDRADDRQGQSPKKRKTGKKQAVTRPISFYFAAQQQPEHKGDT